MSKFFSSLSYFKVFKELAHNTVCLMIMRSRASVTKSDILTKKSLTFAKHLRIVRSAFRGEFASDWVVYLIN